MTEVRLQQEPSVVVIGKRRTLQTSSDEKIVENKDICKQSQDDAFSVLKKEQLRVRQLMYDIMDHKCPRSEMKNLKFGTYEWCDETYNIQKTDMCCKYYCLYCYARNMALDNKREQKNSQVLQLALKEKHSQMIPSANLPQLSICDDKKVNKGWLSVYNKDDQLVRKRKVFMAFSTHDIYPETVAAATSVFEKMMLAGHCVLVVSKPNLFCIKYICEKLALYTQPRKMDPISNATAIRRTTGYLQFRFTIGTDDAKIMSAWEPFAPKLEERLECLKYAYDHGFITSISMEPLLSEPYKLIEIVAPYVRDSIWIGEMNFTHIPSRLDIEDTVLDETRKQSDKIINIVTTLRKSKYTSLIHWKESVVTTACLRS
jgi:hypothetical protein